MDRIASQWDETRQENAIANPTDDQVYIKAPQALARQAKRAVLELRHSHTCLTSAAMPVSRASSTNANNAKHESTPMT